jgi:hypothetical protein
MNSCNFDYKQLINVVNDSNTITLHTHNLLTNIPIYRTINKYFSKSKAKYAIEINMALIDKDC